MGTDLSPSHFPAGAWEMRRQRYQPGIQNGPVAKRRTGAKNSATSKAFAATRPSSRRHSNRASNRLSNRAGRRRQGEGRGASVMWGMILIGAALSAVFIFALRSQINTHKIAQAEERLKMKLDEYAGQQKFLELDQQRALNTDESDRAGRRKGLDQLKLDQAGPPAAVANQLPAPLRAPQVGQKTAKVVPAKVVPAKVVPAKVVPAKVVPAKVVPAKVVPAKVVPAKVVKVVKSSAPRSNAAKSPRVKARVVKAPIVKIKKQSNNQRQTSRSQ